MKRYTREAVKAMALRETYKASTPKPFPGKHPVRVLWEVHMLNGRKLEWHIYLGKPNAVHMRKMLQLETGPQRAYIVARNMFFFDRAHIIMGRANGATANVSTRMLRRYFLARNNWANTCITDKPWLLTDNYGEKFVSYLPTGYSVEDAKVMGADLHAHRKKKDTDPTKKWRIVEARQL